MHCLYVVIEGRMGVVVSITTRHLARVLADGCRHFGPLNDDDRGVPCVHKCIDSGSDA